MRVVYGMSDIQTKHVGTPYCIWAITAHEMAGNALVYQSETRKFDSRNQ